MRKNTRGKPKYGLRIKDYEHGILDIDYAYQSDRKTAKAYKIWQAMFRRLKKRVEYNDCCISEEWHYFSNFLKWFNENYINGYHLDKDVLKKGNRCYCSEYCSFIPPEINSLLTNRKNHRNALVGTVKTKSGKYQAHVNKKGISFFLGTFDTQQNAFNAYKTAKEAHIKQVAQEYYDAGKITKRVYDALMKYEVEITD